MINDTIIALASATMKQAIAIIRISGPEAFSLINKVFSKEVIVTKQSAKVFGVIINPQTKAIIDEVVLVCYYGKKSFTGEDTVEINCHGNMLIVNKIMKLLLTIQKNDQIRLATPGEFTRRAFLNNKIDLLQAEAVNNLVNAPNEVALGLALNSLNGKNSKRLQEIEAKLLYLITNIAVTIDYPEYDTEANITRATLLDDTKQFQEKLTTISQQSKIAQIISEGIDTVIVGKPNVGKSTLLNAFLKEDRAITSNLPGTTRDIVTGKIIIDNISLNLIDTAGIRNTTDNIENLGIIKAKQYLEKAQLVLLVLDANQPLDQDDETLINLVMTKNHLLVLNKSDLNSAQWIKNYPSAILISALKNNYNSLIEAIKAKFFQDQIDDENNLILTATYHQSLLEKIIITINEALIALQNQIPLDLVMLHFQEAWDYLQEINGKIIKDDILDEMFKRFCLGK